MLERSLAVAARAFGPVDFAYLFLPLRGAKPWRGRALEGSGGSGARFWTRGFCVEGSSLLASRGAKPRRALLDLWILRGKVVTLGLEGRETVAGAYFRR